MLSEKVEAAHQSQLLKTSRRSQCSRLSFFSAFSFSSSVFVFTFAFVTVIFLFLFSHLFICFIGVLFLIYLSDVVDLVLYHAFPSLPDCMLGGQTLFVWLFYFAQRFLYFR